MLKVELRTWRHAAPAHRRRGLRWRILEPSPAIGSSLKSRAAVPWGLVGMFVLLAGLEAWIARRPLDFSEPVSLNWRLSLDAAEHAAQRASVLCLGDSLVKHSMIPRALEAETGRPAVNLANARGPAPLTYFVLRRALENGATPDAVVVDFKPAVLVGDTRYNLRYWQEVVSLREFVELLRTSGGGTLGASLALGRLLPSVRDRLEIRSGVLAFCRGETSLTSRQNRICDRNWGVNGGANVAARNPAFTGALSSESIRTLHAGRFYCNRINRLFLDRFFRLAAERHVPVYWLLPPVAPELQTVREKTGAEERYLVLVRQIVRTFPNVTILDGRHSAYPSSVFVDPTHVDKQGGWTLSRDVGSVVRRDLAGPLGRYRWVALPDYRELPIDGRLEDVEESKRLLKLSP